MAMRPVSPQGMAQPKGYSHGMKGTGEVLFVAGQIGWNAAQRFESDDFVAQAAQALANIAAVLRAADALPEHIVRLTWYVVDKREYLASLAALAAPYRAVMGRHYPAMTAVEVSALIEDRARVEIEATAVVPRPAAG